MTPGAVVDGLIDLLLPKRCVQCRAVGSWLCEPCAAGLRALPVVRCPRCGAPGRWTPCGAGGRTLRAVQSAARGAVCATPGVAAAGGVRRAGRPCPECSGRELAFVTAAAAFTYEGPARALVAACKFRGLRSLAAEMANLAGPAFGDALPAGPAGGSRHTAGGRPAVAPSDPAATVVTWVPGHRGRSLERGFNQAELLARRLACAAGLPYAPLLRRVRHGARQSGLDRAARAFNVQGAFALREDANRVLMKLKRVVVVDDVYTTGETLNHCAEVLAHADLEPHVFTFARTVRAASSQASLDHAVQKERCR